MEPALGLPVRSCSAHFDLRRLSEAADARDLAVGKLAVEFHVHVELNRVALAEDLVERLEHLGANFRVGCRLGMFWSG